MTNIQPPIVILPMSQWNKMSQKGLRFALKLSPDIFAVQVRAGGAGEDDLTRQWAEYVEGRRGARPPGAPARDDRVAVPPCLQSAARLHPRDQAPASRPQIAVLIPELVARRWYHHLLHNKRAAMLKALLLVRGDEDIVVINVPWYLSE